MPELFHDGRNSQLVQRRDPGRDEAKDAAVTVRLLEEIAAESRAFIHFVGEIEVAALFKKLPTLRAANLAQHFRRLFSRHRFRSDRHHISVSPHFGRLPLADVQIGAASFYDHGEELVYVSHGQMTKHEGRRTKEYRNPKSENGSERRRRHSSFVIISSFVIRASSLPPRFSFLATDQSTLG